MLENSSITSENALEVLKDLHTEVKEIRNELNKYKGFAGGIWFVLSCIAIFFSAFKFFHR